MKPHLRCLLLVLLGSAAGCEFEPLTASGGHPPVAAVQLLGPDGAVLPPNPVLPAGERTRIRAQFLDPAGNPVPQLDDTHSVEFFWGPDGFTHVERVPGEPLARDLVVLAAPCAQGQLSIGYGHHQQSNEKVFGPLPVRVKPEVVDIRLRVDGEVQADSVPLRLRKGRPVRLAAELLQCDGQRAPAGAGSLVLYWSSGDFARAAAVPNEPFVQQVEILAPPCTPGTLSIGYLQNGKQVRVFGPFAVAVDSGAVNARLFSPSGEEVTQRLVLPARQRTRLEARFFGCGGARLPGPQTAAAMQFYWAPDQFAHTEAVAGQPSVREVVPLVPEGTDGTLSVGLQSGGANRVFGPFPVRVR